MIDTYELFPETLYKVEINNITEFATIKTKTEYELIEGVHFDKETFTNVNIKDDITGEALVGTHIDNLKVTLPYYESSEIKIISGELDEKHIINLSSANTLKFNYYMSSASAEGLTEKDILNIPSFRLYDKSVPLHTEQLGNIVKKIKLNVKNIKVSEKDPTDLEQTSKYVATIDWNGSDNVDTLNFPSMSEIGYEREYVFYVLLYGVKTIKNGLTEFETFAQPATAACNGCFMDKISNNWNIVTDLVPNKLEDNKRIEEFENICSFDNNIELINIKSQISTSEFNTELGYVKSEIEEHIYNIMCYTCVGTTEKIVSGILSEPLTVPVSKDTLDIDIDNVEVLKLIDKKIKNIPWTVTTEINAEGTEYIYNSVSDELYKHFGQTKIIKSARIEFPTEKDITDPSLKPK